MKTAYSAASQIPHQLPDGKATIAVRQGATVYKLAGLLFPNSGRDFYIMLPYLRGAQMSCGLRRHSGPSQSQDFSIVSDTPVPLGTIKMSYHESGRVHFKTQAKGFEKSGPLAKSSSIAIDDLTGDHLFSIDVEVCKSFNTATKKELLKPSLFIFEPMEDIDRLHISGWGGKTAEQVSGKKQAADGSPLPPHHTIIAIRRDREPLYVGLYFEFGPSMQSEKCQPMALVVSGFKRLTDGVDFLFLSATQPTAAAVKSPQYL